MTGNEYFAQWLENQVTQSGISYQDLSDMTGISETSIDRWFAGRHMPKLGNLIAMCEVFGKCQDRSPQQMVFEALMHVPEMLLAQNRWKRKMNAKEQAKQ